jgi:RNA polymerase sigma-70 factor (ECF subfamily)
MNLQSRMVKTHQDRSIRQQAIDQPDDLWRLQAGDPRAWEQFVAEWSPRLYSYLLASLRRADEAQTVLNTTMLAIVHAIRRFDGRVTLSVFVYTIAYRQLADYRRLRSSTQRPSRLNLARSSQPSDEVGDALLGLPEQAQQVLLLRYQVGLSVAEIAQVLGRSSQATAALLNQVRHQFETEFLRGANA